MFGKHKLVQTRNHNKEFRRDMAKIDRLCAALDEAPDVVRQFNS